MKITRITAGPLNIPLKKPFITAQRTVYALENVLITVHTNTGQTGYGEAATATAVTGGTASSIKSVVLDIFAPVLLGRDIGDINSLTQIIQQTIPYNTSAKAAMEAALFDLFAQKLQVPLCGILGAGKNPSLPDNGITISAGSASTMASDCLEALDGGYALLKIKLGKQPAEDGETLIYIHKTLQGKKPKKKYTFRIDANCGWLPKEAIQLIRKWEDAGIPIAWVEQPTGKWDITGLKTVTRHTHIPIMADESVFHFQDAARLLEAGAVDWVNIKLAKAGGLTPARDIAVLCKAYGIPWMMGCMLESRLAAGTAAAFAAACGASAIDLDGPLLCMSDPFTGGVSFDGTSVTFSGKPIQLLEETP
jgi:L-alanine-DL-glutamate epimerase-like enolase superfamily enzyme